LRKCAIHLEAAASIERAVMHSIAAGNALIEAKLAPVYGWFTVGFETRDLKDAKALLEELGT
jgi:hypothetical protein